MPISADPDRTVEYFLEADAESKKRAFTCRFMSMREHERIADLIESTRKMESEKDIGKAMLDAIAVGVVGWRGFDGKPFSPEAVAETLTPDEVQELAISYRYAVIARERELGNSRRASSSAGKASAAATSPSAK